jgi:hypothetical protein
MATVKEAFTVKYQGNTKAEMVEVSFVPGEEVKVLSPTSRIRGGQSS